MINTTADRTNASLTDVARSKFTTAICTYAILFVVLALSSPCEARPWYYPQRLQKATVNPYLTPTRLVGTCSKEWQDQLVLWEGSIAEQSGTPERRRLSLEVSGKKIPVLFVRPVKNLDTDRRGYRVAVKGKIHLEKDKFSCLYGLSVILLAPPPERSFAHWLGTDTPNLANYVAWRVSLHQPQLSRSTTMNIGTTLVATAKRENFDPLLFAALIQIESAYDPHATSVSGAQGLGQLMPTTAKGLGVSDAYEPLQNLQGSGKMLGNLQREWQSSPNPSALVLASYNAGPNCVRRLGGKVPPYAETVNYVYFIGFLRQMLNAHTRAIGVSV